MTEIPSGFAEDYDPFTEEDGRGDDVNQPLPDVDSGEDEPEGPSE